MSKSQEETGAPSYLQKVGEDNRRYAHNLLAENERLRLVVASLLNDKLHITEKLQLTEAELQHLRDEREQHAQDGEELRRQIADIEVQNQRFSEEYVEVEKRNNNLMNLYVASYRLHGTLERDEVLGTIQEIVANLVGCEEHAVFEVGPEGDDLRLVASVGLDPDAYRRVPFGEGAIGRAAAAGTPYIPSGEPEPAEAGLTACIPLKLNDKVTGAIALFRLLPQKPGLEEIDHELFDLLATHAATALYCTKLHSGLGAAQAAR